MVSFGARQALSSTAAVAAALVACAAAALDAAAFDERQRQFLDEIQEIQARDGPSSPALLDELMGLILLYRESEEHTLAVVAIEQALQVVRANSGLYSLDQVPLLWQRISSEEARGNHAAVWDLEQALLTLVRRYPDDVRAVPVLHDMADRQMQVLQRVVDTGDIPPQVIYGCFYKQWPIGEDGCSSGERKTVVQGMLAEANRNYADAIGILLRNELYSSDELRELELQVARGADLIRTEYEREALTGTRMRYMDPVPLMPWTSLAKVREPWKSRVAPIIELAEWEFPYDSAGRPEQDFLQEDEPESDRFRAPYYRGRQSLRRLYVYGVADGSPRLTQAGAIVQMADWDLLYSHNRLAIEGYSLARGMLEEAGADETSIAQLFAPALPVVLPSFEPNPLARDETAPATGHVDVVFAITKYGRARDIEIRAGANATDGARANLVGLLKSSRFRPRLTTGRLADSTPVVVRYYLTE